jgi:PAS domain S-box-containing protein
MENTSQGDLASPYNEAASRQALSISEARYRRLFETAQDGILILDAKSGLIIDVNPFLIALLDLPLEEFIGKTLWDIGPFKNVDASKAAFRELQDKKYVRYDDLPLETRSGRPISVEFVSNVYGVNGKSIIQCNVRDITARKQAEEVQEQLRQYQKMEAIGQLAGGIAHDFNNLLGVILGYCEILALAIPAEDPKSRMVEQIHSAGFRAVTLTRQLLAFSRRQVLQPVALDLNRVVTGMEVMLRRLIGEHIQVVTVLCPDLGSVRADPGQMEVILLNLAVNARDAMPEGGVITIETSNVDLGENEPAPTDVKPGSYVMLTVMDTGTGMDNETRAHIFEPFFTTKQPGKGTGLGLATVYGIVKQSAGHIWVQTDVGRGTTFKVYLPRVHEEPKAVIPDAGLNARRGLETILVVEDYAPLRELTREMLVGAGYTVLDAGAPSEAIRIADQYKGVIALLISDVVMPETNGLHLAEALTASRPEMKVLFTSGYRYDASEEPGHVTHYPFLEKPFTGDDLRKRIRELLDSPNSPKKTVGPN